jgi:hypothetical protein
VNSPLWTVRAIPWLSLASLQQDDQEDSLDIARDQATALSAHADGLGDKREVDNCL